MSLISNHRKGIELGCTKLDKIKDNTTWKLRSQILQFKKRFEKKEITFVNQLK
jgi:GTP-binding protein EngB required for normal cell division